MRSYRRLVRRRIRAAGVVHPGDQAIGRGATEESAAPVSVFAAHRVKPLLFAALLARMPIGMGAVGLILFIHGETGSFGSAGVVTGAFTIGIGITGPLLARQIDRRGQLVFIYFSWQLLQAPRNCPINLLNSSRRLVLLASWASFEAVEAR